MKKRILILFLIAIFLISMTSALEIKTQKNQFMKGETFQATLSGNILQNIKSEDVGFYRGHVLVPVTSGIAKINNTYYIYGVLPYASENYSLQIKNVYFQEQNQIKTVDLIKNFSISNETASFNFQPGFIISSKDFDLTLANNLDSNLQIDYSFIANSSHSIELLPSESKKVTIDTSEIKSSTFTSLTLTAETSYQMPVYIIKNDSSSQIINDSYSNLNSSRLKFALNYINETLEKSKSFSHILELLNLGNRETGPIYLNASNNLIPYISFNKNQIEFISANNFTTFNFTANFNKTGNFSGFIFAISNDSYDYLNLNFIIGENVTVITSIITQSNQKSCFELGGKICTLDQTCSQGVIPSSEGFSCCLADCISLNSGQSLTNWWMILIVVIIIIGIIAFLLIKYKKPKISNPLKDQTKDFEKRFETKGKLTKV